MQTLTKEAFFLGGLLFSGKKTHSRFATGAGIVACAAAPPQGVHETGSRFNSKVLVQQQSQRFTISSPCAT